MARTPHREDPAVTAAVDAVVQRVHTTAEQVGERFPLFADPGTGQWTTTRRGSWTGGFWSGLLWTTAARTGSPGDRARAAAVTARLRQRVEDDTDTRALTFWYGAAQGFLRCGDTLARDVALAGAAALAGAWSPEWGAVPAGTALGRGTEGETLLTVDSAAAVVDLLSWAARAQGRDDWWDVARRHAWTTLRRCVRQDGAVLPAANLAGGEQSGAHEPGRWARGQAWGILALTAAAENLVPSRETFREAACAAADFWLARTKGGVPVWDLAEPDGPPDTSAGAIAAEALLRLADLVDGPAGRSYREAAQETVFRLTDEHLTPGGTERPAGMLVDGCYDLPSRTAVAHELVWGTYFHLSALVRMQAFR